MTAEWVPGVVFVADSLERQFPEIHRRLAAIFRGSCWVPAWVA